MLHIAKKKNKKKICEYLWSQLQKAHKHVPATDLHVHEVSTSHVCFSDLRKEWHGCWILTPIYSLFAGLCIDWSLALPISSPFSLMLKSQYLLTLSWNFCPTMSTNGHLEWLSSHCKTLLCSPPLTISSCSFPHCVSPYLIYSQCYILLHSPWSSIVSLLWVFTFYGQKCMIEHFSKLHLCCVYYSKNQYDSIWQHDVYSGFLL